MKKMLAIAILFFFVCTTGYSQEKLYGKGCLFVTWDAGLSFNYVNRKDAFNFKNAELTPSFGFSADYKFLKSPFGIQGGLFFDKYQFQEISLRYISLPLQANMRFGKTTQVKISGGISQSFLVNSKIASSLEVAEAFEASSKKYLVGLVANVEVSTLR